MTGSTPPGPSTPLTAEERRSLLKLARQAVVARVRGLRDESMSPPVFQARVSDGAFVTLHQDGRLRGCIGRVAAGSQVGETVRQVAGAAAVEDPRFPPVTPGELSTLTVEVSLLGPLVPCSGPGDVEIGRHGVVIRKGHRQSLLLPQVAIEHGWDAEALVSAACRKAGLPSDAWATGSDLYVFEAEVFAEDDAEPQGSRCP